MDKPKPAPEPAVPDMHRRVPQYLVRRVAQICNAIQSEAYADHGLMPWQFAVLMQVRSRPGMDRNWHAAAAGCDATSVGQTLERWVSQGLAVRGINPLDRRAGAYSLTPEAMRWPRRCCRVRARRPGKSSRRSMRTRPAC